MRAWGERPEKGCQWTLDMSEHWSIHYYLACSLFLSTTGPSSYFEQLNSEQFFQCSKQNHNHMPLWQVSPNIVCNTDFKPLVIVLCFSAEGKIDLSEEKKMPVWGWNEPPIDSLKIKSMQTSLHVQLLLKFLREERRGRRQVLNYTGERGDNEAKEQHVWVELAIAQVGNHFWNETGNTQRSTCDIKTTSRSTTGLRMFSDNCLSGFPHL